MSHSDISYYNKCFTEENLYYENVLVVNNKTYDKYSKLNIKNMILLENNIPLLTINSKNTFDKNNIKCLFFSRVSYDKNIIMLMQAIDKLSNNYNIHLDIYSEFNYTLNYYYNLIVNKSSITICNPVSNLKLIEIYKLYDIVILPSVSEGCSLNVLESINNEIPIICTKNIGNYEIINDELPMFEFDGLSICDDDIYVFNYNKNLFEIVNKIEYTINNYTTIKQNTIKLKNKISDKFFNMASYIMKLNNLLDNTNIFINKPVL